jgi:hypothetical protein
MSDRQNYSQDDSQDDRERFVRDIMARTSGSPCARAERLLPDLNDGVLAELDRQLVQAHLEHCAPCRSLAVAMARLEPVLSQLAVVDPGPVFTAGVLAHTSRRKHLAALPSSARPGGVPGLMDRLGRWWGERILIPGFPARMAYAATVVLVLLTAVPGAPLRGVPRTALKVATAGPTAVPAVAEASAWLDGQLAEVRGGMVAQWQVVDGNLGARLARTAEARRQAAGHLSAAWRELEDHRLGEAGYEGLGAIDASRRIWTLWWHGDEQSNGE